MLIIYKYILVLVVSYVFDEQVLNNIVFFLIKGKQVSYISCGTYLKWLIYINVLNTLYNSDILEIKVILMLTKLGFRTTDRLTNVNLIHPSLKYIVSGSFTSDWETQMLSQDAKRLIFSEHHTMILIHLVCWRTMWYICSILLQGGGQKTVCYECRIGGIK